MRQCLAFSLGMGCLALVLAAGDASARPTATFDTLTIGFYGQQVYDPASGILFTDPQSPPGAEDPFQFWVATVPNDPFFLPFTGNALTIGPSNLNSVLTGEYFGFRALLPTDADRFEFDMLQRRLNSTSPPADVHVTAFDVSNAIVGDFHITPNLPNNFGHIVVSVPSGARSFLVQPIGIYTDFDNVSFTPEPTAFCVVALCLFSLGGRRARSNAR